MIRLSKEDRIIQMIIYESICKNVRRSKVIRLVTRGTREQTDTEEMEAEKPLSSDQSVQSITERGKHTTQHVDHSEIALLRCFCFWELIPW